VIRTLVATGTAVLLAAGSPGAHRCECFGAGDACAEFARVDAVFAGRVRSIDDGRVEFAVTESFRGIHQPTVVLYQPGSTCDFPFDVGKQYFVYPHEGFDGRLTASILQQNRVVVGEIH
jgi:hypothetical protein